MKCDVIAKGVMEAATKVNVDVPIIVRLTGTNADIAVEMLGKFAEENKDKLHIVVNRDFDSAAQTAVSLAALEH